MKKTAIHDIGPPAEKVGMITPLARAVAELGKRCQIKQGAYYVDGQPVNIHTVLERANKLIAERGGEIIKWRYQHG